MSFVSKYFKNSNGNLFDTVIIFYSSVNHARCFKIYRYFGNGSVLNGLKFNKVTGSFTIKMSRTSDGSTVSTFNIRAYDCHTTVTRHAANLNFKINFLYSRLVHK